MVSVPLLDSKFVDAGSVDVGVNLGAVAINEGLVHQVVQALLANRRQGNACTKNKALIQGGGAKPFKQKGTGRARQGSSRSPLLVGGGTVFGPTPRDFGQKVNKKVSKKAIQAVLADKFQAGKLLVLDKVESSGKTKDLSRILKERNLESTLLVVNDDGNVAIRAARNLPKCKCLPVKGFSVLEALRYENLVMEKTAFENLVSRLEK